MRDTPTILLVDDNPVNLKVAQMLLKKQNVRVDSVTNGESAVEAVKKKPYQMVLMDIELPGINGLEATKKIRQWEKNRSPSSSHSDHPRPVPIIALTAHDEKETREACLDVGMDDVMEKPIRSEKIEIALKHIRRNPKTREKTSSRILDALTKTAQSVPVDNPEAAIRHLMTFTLGKEKYAFDMDYIKKNMPGKGHYPRSDPSPAHPGNYQHTRRNHFSGGFKGPAGNSGRNAIPGIHHDHQHEGG